MTSFEKIPKEKEKHVDIRNEQIFLDARQKELKHKDLYSELNKEYSISKATTTRALRQGWFKPNFFKMPKYGPNENINKEYIDLISKKANIATGKMILSYEKRLSPRADMFRKDFYQEAILSVLNQSEYLKSFIDDPDMFERKIYVMAYNGARHAFEKYLLHKSNNSTYLAEDYKDENYVLIDGEKVKKSEPIFMTREIQDEYIERLKPILKVFIEHGAEVVSTFFNIKITPKIEALMYECAIRNKLFEFKSFQAKVLDIIFDFFPEAQVQSATTGSLYIKILNNEKLPIFIRVSDHPKSPKEQREVSIDINNDNDNWFYSLEELRNKISGISKLDHWEQIKKEIKDLTL